MAGSLTKQGGLTGNLAKSETLKGNLANPHLRGYSAYEVAVQNGFEGTEKEWLESLKGSSDAEVTVKSITDALNYMPADLEDVEKLSKDVEELKEKEVDLTGYATESYVQSYAQPKGNYADSKHTHDEYLTEHQDLSNYAKKSDIPTDYAKSDHEHNQYLTSIPNEYVTESELNSKGYLTEHQSLTDYAKKSELPTKTSQLVNDSGFLTKDDNVVVDLSEYSTTEQNDAKYQPKGDYSTIGHTHSEYLTEHQDISNLAKKDELHSHNNKSVLDNISQENIDNWNNKSDFSGSYNDLTNKPTIPTKVSELDNDSNFITSVPLEYVTETELSQKGYATESFVTNKIAEAELSGSDVDLSGLATKDELNNKVDKIKGKSLIDDTEIERLAKVVNYDDTEIKNQINSKADKTEIPSKVSQLENDKNYLTSVPNEYITETELTNKGYLTQHQSLSDYAKKTELPTKVSQLENDSKYLTSVPSEYITESELNAKGYLTQHQSLADYAKKSELPTKTSQLANDSGFITDIPNEYATETEVQAMIDASPSVLFINVSGDEESGYVSDKTFAEINQAHESGMALFVKITYTDMPLIVPLAVCTRAVVMFSTIMQNVIVSVMITADESLVIQPTEMIAMEEFVNHSNDDIHITSAERMAWNNKSNFSGSYSDLTNKPTIPTKTSQLTNDSNFVTKAVTDELSDEIVNLKALLIDGNEVEY